MAWQRTDSANITAADLRVLLFMRKIEDGYGNLVNALHAHVDVDTFQSINLLLETVGTRAADVTLTPAQITAMQTAAAAGDFVAVLEKILLPVATAALPLLGYIQV